MSRDRTTPYPAQLERFLSEHNSEQLTFSAATLAEQFESPRQQKATGKIGAIHKALQRAFADGKVVRFIDDHGMPLREEDFAAPGSAAVEHPLIFATPGTPSPQDGYAPVTEEQERGMRANGSLRDRPDETADQNGSAVAGAGDGAVDDPDGDRASAADDGGDEKDLAHLLELARRMRDWQPSEPAPEWLPSALLERWVRLPGAAAQWRAGLDKADRQRKFALINAGIKRKGSLDEVTAGKMAKLCRQDVFLWEVCWREAESALHERDERGELLEGLADVERDPIGFAEIHLDCPPELVVLVGIALGSSAEDLEALAHDVVDRGERADAASLEQRLRHRAAALDFELDELRDELKQSKRELAASAARAERAEKDLAKLREKQAGADDAGVALKAAQSELDGTRRQIADLEADAASTKEELAKLPELVAQARAAENVEMLVGAREEELARERNLRVKSEDDVQEQLRRVRELTQQLRQTRTEHVRLPADDARAFLQALAPTIGDAVRAAGERMLVGSRQPDDHRLLQLASAYGELCADGSIIPASDEAGKPREVADRPPAEGESPVSDPTLIQNSNSAAGAPPSDEPELALPADTASTNGHAQVMEEVVPAGAREPAEETDVSTEATEDDAATRADESTTSSPRRVRQAQQVFTVRAIGGAEEVGGSALLVSTHDGSNVLLDAGQRVRGEYGAVDVGQFHYGISGVEHLHGVLITHAHIDHVGSLPLVVQEHSERQSSEVPVWMSEPTAQLARIMLADSARIQDARGRLIEDAGVTDLAPGTVDPAYTTADASAVMEGVGIAPPSEAIPIPGTDLVAKFLRVSHVLGSCAIHLRHRSTGASLLYTGDLGPLSEPQATLPDFNGTAGLEAAEIVVMESTYAFEDEIEREGRRRRLEGRERALQLLSEAATKAIDRGGFVLLPAFSLGRTQELAKIIGRERGRSVPEGRVYLGGMGEKILQIYDEWGASRRGRWARPGEFPATTSISSWLQGGTTFEDAATEILAEEDPGYLIVSPAMLSGGWSRAFLREMVGDERHAVLFTGYMPRHAGGIPHIHRAHKGGRLRLDQEELDIRCDWGMLKGLSAHPPTRDLHRFASEMTSMSGGAQVQFGCMHGEAASQQELAGWIEENVDCASARSLQRNTPWRPGRL